MKFYTGIGSRKTPDDIGKLMHLIAAKLADDDFVLRSGGASGADTFFENGCDSARGQKEIYIPWKGFSDRTDGIYETCNVKYAECVASKVHPVWDRLSRGARALHSRNVFQVLGNCNDMLIPSDFLICWAPSDKLGIPIGGTRTAWVVAQMHGVQCHNIYNSETRFRVMQWLGLDSDVIEL